MPKYRFPKPQKPEPPAEVLWEGVSAEGMPQRLTGGPTGAIEDQHGSCKPPGSWYQLLATGRAYDVAVTIAAELAAATARAEKAERALRLEQGRPAEGDLPPGWTFVRRLAVGVSYSCGEVRVWDSDVGEWFWAARDADLFEAATAAEAIDAAQAALEGGDDE